MSLRFPGIWRFTPPVDGNFINASIPPEAVQEFVDVIAKLRTEKGRWWVFEHFKRGFGASSESSSESWAETDLSRAMDFAAQNAPMFIEQFIEALDGFKRFSIDSFIPDVALLNAILAKHNVGYEIRPPDLVQREIGGPLVSVATVPVGLAERARDILETSLQRSEELLAQGRPREAVQEVLWLLETVATAFRGLETQSGKIEGTYFNKIVADLRKKHPGTTLDRVLDWISAMHGYLSSPKGGGVRHGIDLDGGVDLDANQARLFCNLTRSYISYLIVEYDSLFRARP